MTIPPNTPPEELPLELPAIAAVPATAVMIHEDPAHPPHPHPLEAAELADDVAVTPPEGPRVRKIAFGLGRGLAGR